MDIFKIVGVGILGVITAGFIKSAKSEFSVFVVLATGLVILIMIAKGMSEVLVKFSEIVAKTGIPSALYGAILKIVGVGYLTEFSAGICEDRDIYSGISRYRGVYKRR